MPQEYSREDKLPESYESALKRIPLDDSTSAHKNILKGSQSESKLQISSTKKSKGNHSELLKQLEISTTLYNKFEPEIR